MADQQLTGDSTETERLRVELAAAEAVDPRHGRTEPASPLPRSRGRPGFNAIRFPTGIEPLPQPAGPAAEYGYGSNVLGDAEVHLID